MTIKHRALDRDAEEYLIHDEETPCPYLNDLVARMPLRMPTTTLSPEQFDTRLSEGDRRSGPFLYRTNCPTCQACEAIRIDVPRFQANKTQHRVLRRGDKQLSVRIGQPVVDQQRVDMFNAHRHVRGLVGLDREIDEQGYSAFLVQTCCETLEICYHLDQQLVAVAIFDCGRDAISAVYCFFDPRFSRLSLGTYSVLKQIEFCRQWKKRYVYLGYYVRESRHMSYKARFLPHERLIEGCWQKFDPT